MTRERVIGLGIIDELCDLRADPILIKKAAHDSSMRLECAMEICLCPEGRTYFERRGGRKLWAPSADRWPVPKRSGGEYLIENVRLAHFQCNAIEGARIGGPLGGAVRATQWRGTPEQRELMARAGRLGGRARHTNPESDYREHLAAAGRIGIRRMTKEMLSAAGRKGGTVANAKRIMCECGKVTNPGAMGRHVKVSGHRCAS